MSVDPHTTDRSSTTAPETFRRHGYLVIPQLIDATLANFFWSYVHTKFASLLLGSGGPLVPGSLGDYSDPTFEGLLEFLRPRVEECSGLALYPTYSHFRLYKHGDLLRCHRDRSACEISISLNIGQAPAGPWPLYVEGSAASYAAQLAPGDALLYRGIDLYHWREAYAGRQLIQVFLHYVDRQGPHADQRFDGRKTLMRRPEHRREGGSQGFGS
ncbi:MAG: hypothetical protein WB868_04220 [Xanthobacteraceae bacterium]